MLGWVVAINSIGPAVGLDRHAVVDEIARVHDRDGPATRAAPTITAIRLTEAQAAVSAVGPVGSNGRRSPEREITTHNEDQDPTRARLAGFGNAATTGARAS